MTLYSSHYEMTPVTIAPTAAHYTQWAEAAAPVAGRLEEIKVAIQGEGRQKTGLTNRERSLVTKKEATLKTFTKGGCGSTWAIAWCQSMPRPFDQGTQIWCEKMWVLAHEAP